MRKFQWQVWSVLGMAVVVLVIFGLVIIKLTTPPGLVTVTSPNTTTIAPVSSLSLAVPTLAITDAPLHAPVYGVITSKVLNLRKQPNTGAAVIGSLKFGQIVKLVRQLGGWYQTDTNGWVSALYLEVRQTYPEAQAYAAELQR